MAAAMRSALGIITLTAALGLFCQAARAVEEDLARLLDGVHEIAKPGVPGPVAVFGENAFAVVAGRGDNAVDYAVVAAAHSGQGRVVAFGHGGYFSQGALQVAATGQLVINAARWAAGNAAKPTIGVWANEPVRRLLESRQIDAVSIDENNWQQMLDDLDAMFFPPERLRNYGEIAQIHRFVRRGGGLLVAELGWGWKQLNPGKDLATEHPGNILLSGLGLAFAGGYIHAVDPVPNPTNLAVLEDCHAGKALKLLQAHESGETKLPRERCRQLGAILLNAVDALPPQDRLLLPKLRAALRGLDAVPPPGPRSPLTLDNPLSRVALRLEHQQMMQIPVARTRPYPGAAEFPGNVPAGAGRVSETIVIDVTIPGWAGTGLYAPPGQPVIVELPPRAAGLRLAVRIGCHTDALWQKDQWKRYPAIDRRFRLTDGRTTIANPHGGLIYIEVPGGMNGEPIEVTIRRAVRSPRYVLDETDLEEWRARIRHYPAPWAELETSKIILSVPSTSVRELDDPQALMRRWDEILDCYAELGQRPLARRPQRMVPDVQISVGYMHSGYPIMMHMDRALAITRTDQLKDKWGLWHELGHNHQQPDWTFAGAGEVTCNLFTLYVIEKVFGIPAAEHPNVTGQAEKAHRHIAAGAPFDTWRSDPFLALYMYMQIQQAFGWEAYQAAFAKYRDLPNGDRPKSDDEKRDQWLVQLSRAVNRDLGPFFEAWGVPTSTEARQSLGDLEAWMPPAEAGDESR
ncbi:MAG: M60 family metallopeptidase [Phycisphaerales bacterium]|nr:MAG: M60 family metallopeptidase [Phycisphaerales bacterium]